MPHYDPTTGHTTSPHAHAFDDVDDSPRKPRQHSLKAAVIRLSNNAAPIVENRITVDYIVDAQDMQDLLDAANAE